MHYSDLPSRLAEIQGKIAESSKRGGHGREVTIVAVTKTHGVDAVEAAWNAGIRHCGENKVQEAFGKIEETTHPVMWHLIGHLQRNKVHALEHFSLFHALDSSRLADAISKYAEMSGRAVDVLIQVNTSGEVTKGGFTLEQLLPEADRLVSLPGIRVKGAMTMAPLDANETVLRATFSGARRAREILEAAGHPAHELSMGMSNDYEIAVEEGATLVRVGTVLFGARPSHA